ncbi:hypothetical protein [Umezawaea beigongshangensis]|uniref:hypothetical protein n=1 Tax=Umezawaea beigongshangensis TaxID=2780383 RepID=UPI0018F14584|nr:hypothetical protein [Umezawaea beigongshangensis]
MTDDDGPVLHAERGATWWPVLWGPLFALVAIGVEALTGPVLVLPWLAAGTALALPAAVWVQGRRAIGSVRLTRGVLRQGRETLRVSDLAEVDDVGRPVGARVLGGGWNVPRGTTELPVRLADGTVVIAWARDPDALRRGLREVLPA